MKIKYEKQKGEIMKNKNVKILKSIYDKADEDTRLTRSRHGQLEFFTTMHYIKKYLKPNMKILEVGAGTGRYSISLAKEGYDVTAVEPIKSNLKVLKDEAKGIKNIKSYQGDALDLSRFEDNSFDIVLVLGPLYHLYNEKEQKQAINEALKVCKESGILMFAFIPIHNFVYGCGMEGYQSVVETIKENFTEDFKPRQFPEQGFTGFEIEDFKKLFKDFAFKPLHLVSTDSILDLEEDRKNFKMTDEEFEFFKKYHLATCENPTLQGLASHLLYIGKKK